MSHSSLLSIISDNLRDSDEKIELSLLEIIRHFVEEELGKHDGSDSPSYKGYNLDKCNQDHSIPHTSEKIAIDAHIFFTENIDKIKNKKLPCIDSEFEKQLTDHLVNIVRFRNGMWV